MYYLIRKKSQSSYYNQPGDGEPFFYEFLKNYQLERMSETITMSRSNDESKWADPSAIGNLTNGLLILVQAFLMLGLAVPLTTIFLIPWIFMGTVVLVIVVVIQLKMGDLVGATANSILGIIVLGHFLVRGMIDLMFFLNGSVYSAEMISGSNHIEGIGFICTGIILLFVGYLGGFKSRLMAFFIWLAAAGFILSSISCFASMPYLGIIGSCLLLLVALWLIYSGIAILLNDMMQKQVLPLGKPLFTPNDF